MSSLPIEFCSEIAKISNLFEKCNSDLKKEYYALNLVKVINIMRSTIGFKGSFATGYPFYALENDLNGNLPIIDEQIRYNNELVLNVSKSSRKCWVCDECMKNNYLDMPDLKKLCKPCPNMDDGLKPRKVINRLPDLDIWMICEDDKVNEAKEELVRRFSEENLYASDIDPLRTMSDFVSITSDLINGKMPSKYLPLDVHIIEYKKFKEILKTAPLAINNAIKNGDVPYLPIQPHSLRKKWQYDDEAYNFILDYLFSFTPFRIGDLSILLEDTRNVVLSFFSEEEIEELFRSIAPDSVLRRFETVDLQESFRKRIRGWKR